VAAKGLRKQSRDLLRKLKKKSGYAEVSLLDNAKKAVLLTIVAGFLWGTSFPVIKIGLQYMDAYTFVFLRFLTASLVMLAILLFKHGFSFNFSQKRLVLFLGVVNGVAYLMEYVGMVFTTASKSSLLINLSAVWVALLCPIVLGEHLGAKKTVGVTVSLLGVFLTTTNLNFASLRQGTIMGDLLVVGAGVAWAVFMVYNKPVANASKSLIQPMTLLLICTLLPLLPIAPFSAGVIFTLPLEAWLVILFTAVLCWVVPYYLWLKGLQHLSPVTSAIVLLTEIVVAVTISTLFLGEVFTVISGIGAVLIIIAILLVS
jgi:drug/metabolite transporter (DMT)-like permease